MTISKKLQIFLFMLIGGILTFVVEHAIFHGKTGFHPQTWMGVRTSGETIVSRKVVYPTKIPMPSSKGTVHVIQVTVPSTKAALPSTTSRALARSSLVLDSAPKKSATSSVYHHKHNETQILRWKGRGWNHVKHFCNGTYNFQKVTLKSIAGDTPIYIHDLKNDKHVSGSIKRDGIWDGSNINMVVNQLRSDKELGLIDIGSHIGTFSLVAARLGRQVVAVDPLVENVLRFCKSVQDGHLTDQVKIFFAALSDGYRKVSFNREAGNLGGTRIVNAKPNVTISGVYDPSVIDTVLLDDLLPEIPFKKAVMKIDVEQHEYQVLSGAKRFFEKIDIKGILMEWLWQKGPHGAKLKDLLMKMKFKPYTPNLRADLSSVDYKTWPNDVVWMKEKI